MKKKTMRKMLIVINIIIGLLILFTFLMGDLHIENLFYLTIANVILFYYTSDHKASNS